MKNTLFIFDWDDTLFPTSYIISSFLNIEKFPLFNKLDLYLSHFLDCVKNYGDIMIITNATLSWIHTLLFLLPKTKSILLNYPIISARDSLLNFEYKNKSDIWKINVFNSYIDKINKYSIIFNIGDSMNEHNALKYLLDNRKLNNKITISYKLMDNPTYFQLIIEWFKLRNYIERHVKIQ